jgi:hypothetical protein
MIPLAQTKMNSTFNKDIRIEILTIDVLHFPPDATDDDDNPSWIRTKVFKLHKLKMVEEAADEMSDAVIQMNAACTTIHTPIIFIYNARLLEDDLIINQQLYSS